MDFVFEEITSYKIYISVTLCFGILDSFLAGLGRNREYGAYCFVQMAFKPVQTNFAKQKQALRPDCSNIYTVDWPKKLDRAFSQLSTYVRTSRLKTFFA